MRFIGDIHGNIPRWQSLTNPDTPSIQVGDFGIGFLKTLEHKLYSGVNTLNNRFIRGNHDNPGLCDAIPGYIKDGSIYNNVYCVGGAWSIDWQWRTPNVDWWHDEEISDVVFDQILEDYATTKPSIVCTHDGPYSVTDFLFRNDPKISGFGSIKITRTGNNLEQMLLTHKPKLWVFGHWHMRKDVVIDGTRFVCLEEYGVLDINLEDYI